MKSWCVLVRKAVRVSRLAQVLGVLLFLTSCTTIPPRDVNNVCHIFKQYPRWYRASLESEQRWHVPVAIQMAIIHQESKFDGQAMPARTKLLWVIPWSRPSTSYGYTQALRSTWEVYKRSGGSLVASRDSFSDGVDFIGWYANQAHQRAGISYRDPYALYLAYHEGVGGYQRKTYLKKSWLLHVAHKVSAQAERYQAQLNSCKSSLVGSPWYRII